LQRVGKGIVTVDTRIIDVDHADARRNLNDGAIALSDVQEVSFDHFGPPNSSRSRGVALETNNRRQLNPVALLTQVHLSRTLSYPVSRTKAAVPAARFERAQPFTQTLRDVRVCHDGGNTAVVDACGSAGVDDVWRFDDDAHTAVT